MAGLIELISGLSDDITVGELRWAFEQLPSKQSMLSGKHGRYYRVALVPPPPRHEGIPVLREYKVHMKCLTFELVKIGPGGMPASYDWRVKG
jgi:hypothetical protein